MTPDVYSNLQILNCTSSNLVSGTSGAGFFNAYQMYSWFNFPNAPSPLVPSQSMAQYTLQFLRGGGDEDDGADLQINVGTGNTTAANIVWLQARSLRNSGHYIQALLQNCTNGTGPFVVGVVASGAWASAGPANVTWYRCSSTPTVGLGAPDTTQAMAIVDLSQIYPSAKANLIAQAISGNSLEASQAEDLWVQVSAYCNINLLTLSYEIPDLIWVNNPPVQNAQNIIQDFNVSFDSGVLSHQYSLTASFENSVTLTASETWSLGAEIEFTTSIPFISGGSISGSFEAGSSESSTTNESHTYTIEQQITLSEPGTYQIQGYLSIDNNYSSTFNGTLYVTGAVTGANVPVNGTVLSNILLNPRRNEGWQISSSSMTVNPTSVTAPVSGTVAANLAFGGGFTENKLS